MKREAGTEAAARPFALLVGLLAVLIVMHCVPSHTNDQDLPGHSRTAATAAIGDHDRAPHHSHGHGCCQASASAAQSRTTTAAGPQAEQLVASAATAATAASEPDTRAGEPRHAAAYPPIGDRAALMIWRI